jgi:two-component system, OmpR family, sensor kinase
MWRLPIKLRIALVLLAALAVLLAGLGLFIYLRFEARLDQTINQDLRSRTAAIARGIQTAGLPGREQSGPFVEQPESFAQILAPGGRVLAPHAGPASTAFIDNASIAAAKRSPTFVDNVSVPVTHDPVRLLATATVTEAGRHVIIVAGTPLDDRADALASLRDLLIGGGIAALALASLAGYAAVAAALRPVEAMRRRAAEISGADERELLPVGHARDELSRLGSTLNAMLGRIHDALERERRFLDDASHELRTPLALQRAELEVALRYSRDASELRAAIASAIEEADRLIALAEDLLVSARAAGGDAELRPSRVEVGALLAELRDRFAARAAESGREVTVADGAVAVDGDRERLERALANLIENALRHGDGEIALSARAADGRVEIHVADRGPGFPSDFVTAAFDRGTTASDGGAAGAGLGLAIVERIARAHGGRAAAANRPGGGADVWIELPADQD